MTRRLPATLKKRLQANLETLTPLEAGRLALVYFHESTGKKIRVTDYPPMKELLDAMENRVEKARKKPTEKEAVAAYNGFLFLVGLVETVNVEAPNRLLGAAFNAYQTQTLVMTILQQDAAGYVISQLVKELLSQPQPLKAELYDQVVAWLNGDRLHMLSEVAEGKVEEEEIDESEKLPQRPHPTVPKEFQMAYLGLTEEDWVTPGRWKTNEAYEAERRDVRRAWAENQGKQLLQDVFAGDVQSLTDWIDSKEEETIYSEEYRAERYLSLIHI